MLYPLSYGCVLPIVAVLRAGQPPEFQGRPPEALRRAGGRRDCRVSLRWRFARADGDGAVPADAGPTAGDCHMALITLRVLHGADRGRVFSDVSTPVTIGREEGNSIQLNDERISRYHLKLQDDNDKIVATDLESTNGTKINGEEVQVRIIRHGDLIALGRSLLLVGSHSDIDRRIAALAAKLAPAANGHARQLGARMERIANHQSDVVDDMSSVRSPLLPSGPPPLPERLSPAQSAELAELLDYVQGVLREATEDALMRPGAEKVELEFPNWQAMLDLQARLAELLRQIGEPQAG